MSWLSNLFSPSPLPTQYTAVQALQPGAQTTGQQITTTGQDIQRQGTKLEKQANPLLASGESAIATGESELATGAAELAQAQAGVLTPEQQAQLTQARSLETNQAMQMFASQGRSPTKDTSFLGMEEAIDVNMMAAAQKFIQTNIAIAGQMITLGSTTIQAGLGEISGATSVLGAATSVLSAGAQDIGEGLAFETQGANELISAGQAQTSLDNSYTQAVSQAFASIAGMFGTAIGGKSGIGGLNLNFGGTTPAAPAPAP